MTDNLSDLLLREEGYEPSEDFGYVNALGVSVRRAPGGVEQYIKLTARRVEYVRGTFLDTNAEVVPVALFEELKMRPLARNNEDIVDATVRAHRRMAFADDVQATPLAFDYGPGEGALVVNDLRVSGNLAFASLWAQRPGGGAIDIASTPAAQRGQLDASFGDTPRIQVLYRKSGRVWVAVEHAIAATDVWYSWEPICAIWRPVIPDACNF